MRRKRLIEMHCVQSASNPRHPSRRPDEIHYGQTDGQIQRTIPTKRCRFNPRTEVDIIVKTATSCFIQLRHDYHHSKVPSRSAITSPTRSLDISLIQSDYPTKPFENSSLNAIHCARQAIRKFIVRQYTTPVTPVGGSSPVQ